jgi:PAS domain S-box-containing protein
MSPLTHPERLLDDAPVGLATLDTDLRFVRVNPALARMSGIPREEHVGRPVQEVLPRLHQDVVGVMRRVLRNGEPILNVEVGEHQLPPTALPRRWLASCLPVRDEAGETVGLNLVVLDITERSAAEERVRALLGVSVGLAGALTPADVADVIIRHALSTLGAAAGSLVLLSEGGRLEVVRAEGYLPGQVDRAHEPSLDPRLLLARAIGERRPLYFRDEAERTADSHDGLLLCAATHAGATVDLPLLSDDSPVGGLEIVFDEGRDFSRVDRDFLGALAQETAQALERSRLYEAERAARERAEAEHEQRALLAQIVESAEDGIVSTTLDGTVTSWNAGATRIFGYSADEMIGRPLDRIVPENRRAETHELRRKIARGEPVKAHETERVARGGRRVDVSLTIWPLRDSQGRIVGESRIDRDITARRQLEEQLLQAQKMESIGRLAGGVAHDFNNILTAITGYSELLISDLPDGSPAQEYVEAIRGAAERAASLTQQLLAFSRRQVLQPQVLDPNDVVGRMEPLIRRLIGEHIELEASLRATGSIRADPSQLEQVVLNLAVNARDAMPGGGRLSVVSEDAEFDDVYAAEHFEVVPGRYVLLAVTDSGIGMDAPTRARVFEPFFTTKEHGKGTGLGLATIYGIVRQSGGHIWLYSEPGHGTTFKIYFPLVSPATGEHQPARQPAPSRGTETILLVEDEQAVRELARLVLERQGYRVLAAADGREAQRVERGARERIDLLVTDVVMPGIGGPDLAARLLQRRPDLRVLYLSGYTQDAVGPGNELESGLSFLGKPFTPDTLARKVREVLTAGE